MGVAAVLDIYALRDVSQIDAVLATVIDERIGVIPEHIRYVYLFLEYPPLAVRRSYGYEVVPVVFQLRVSIVDARVISGCVFILGIDALRQAFEFDSLDSAVVCESAVVVPSDAGHVQLFLIYIPREGHVLRRVEVMCVRIDERSPRKVFACARSLIAAVLHIQLFREGCQRHAVALSVVNESGGISPCGA